MARRPDPRASQPAEAPNPDSRTRRDPTSRPPLARMLRLHRAMLEHLYPNCQKLAAELEVSAKTIQRDLEYMRSSLGLPIEYDQLKFGFYYSAEVKDFPALEVTEAEVIALLVAEKALGEYRGTHFERPLRAVCRKLTDGMGGRVQLAWEEGTGMLSFRGRAVETEVDPARFAALARAIRAGEEVSFLYHKMRAENEELRQVEPLHLVHADGGWYLLARDPARRGARRRFALARMRELRTTGRTFERSAGAATEEDFEGALGIFGGERIETVELRLSGAAARVACERSWHPSQEIEALGSDVRLRLRVALSPEVERFVLGWGEEAEVLAPAALRERVRERLAAARGRYT